MTYIESYNSFITEKTIKVGEDAVDTEKPIHYALVVDKKVLATGKKNEMLKLQKETKHSRVWKTTLGVDEIVEEAPMNATGAAVSTDKPIVRKKKKDKYEVWRRAALNKKNS